MPEQRWQSDLRRRRLVWSILSVWEHNPWKCNNLLLLLSIKSLSILSLFQLHDAKQLRAQCCKSCLAQLRKAYVVIGQIRKSSQFWISYLEWNASSVFIAESNTLDKTETIQEIEYKSESEADDVDENSSEPTDPDANSKSESPDALYGDDDDDEIVSEINFKRNFDPIGLEEDRPSVQLQCGYCGQNFEDKSSLMKHFNEVHQKNIEPGHTCNVCNKTFTSR